MKARLFARHGPEKGLEVDIGSEATIGRGEGNSVALSSPEVSQRHARIHFDAELAAYCLEDLGSLNGTRLDGVPLTGPERLDRLHLLSFGDSAELFFLALDLDPASSSDAGRPAADRTRVDVEAPTLPVGLRAAGARPAGASTRVEEAPVPLPAGLAGGAAAAPGFVLEVAADPPLRFPLGEGDNLVGRAGRARIRVRARDLSRRHATLRVEAGRVWIRDEGSRNHTYVSGERISEEVELVPGATLHFGRVEARLLSAAAKGEDDDGGR